MSKREIELVVIDLLSIIFYVMGTILLWSKIDSHNLGMILSLALVVSLVIYLVLHATRMRNQKRVFAGLLIIALLVAWLIFRLNALGLVLGAMLLQASIEHVTGRYTDNYIPPRSQGGKS